MDQLVLLPDFLCDMRKAYSRDLSFRMRVNPRGFSLWMFSELSQPIRTQLGLGQICSDEAACGALITLIASEDRSLPMFVAAC